MDTDGLLIALVFTILIEYIVLRCLGERRKKILLSSVVINLLTNVPLNIYIDYAGYDWPQILFGEIVVIIVETLWYWLLTRDLHQSVVYSFLCNAISFLIGLLFTIILEYLG